MGFDAAKTMAFYFSHYLFAPILGAVLGMSAMDFLQSKK
jgi:glycerol uptake facilitator-like aquaporin